MSLCPGGGGKEPALANAGFVRERVFRTISLEEGVAHPVFLYVDRGAGRLRSIKLSKSRIHTRA